MEKVEYTGRTEIGRHTEKDKDGKDKTVIDYASASLNLDTPQTVAEAVKLLGEQRTLFLTRYALTIQNDNSIRKQVLKCRAAEQKTQDAYDKAVQAEFTSYPSNLPLTAERVKGVRKTAKQLKRVQAEATIAELHALGQIPYGCYADMPAKVKAAFDAKYPKDAPTTQEAPSKA